MQLDHDGPAELERAGSDGDEVRDSAEVPADSRLPDAIAGAVPSDAYCIDDAPTDFGRQVVSRAPKEHVQVSANPESADYTLPATSIEVTSAATAPKTDDLIQNNATANGLRYREAAEGMATEAAVNGVYDEVAKLEAGLPNTNKGGNATEEMPHASSATCEGRLPKQPLGSQPEYD